MTQEALKLALEGVEIHSPNSPEYIVCAALIEALAQEQEPVAIVHRNEYNEYRLEPHDNFDIKSIPFNVDVPLFKSPQPKEPEPEQEPVALETLLKWDDDIDDIDPIGEVVGFIEGSPYIMVKVHKVKQVSLDDDLYATPPQRTWQGLTDEDWKEIEDMPDTFDQGVAWAQAKLKEKNT
jgi:hypothetical protein